MLANERKYQFRRRLLTVNRPDQADGSARPAADEYALSEGATLSIPRDEVIYTSRIVAMSFCEPRSWRDILSS